MKTITKKSVAPQERAVSNVIPRAVKDNGMHSGDP